MVRPDFLKKGDTIAIVAPGRKINKSDVDNSIKIFNSWGLNVLVSKNIFSSSHSYLAGSDLERLEDFQTAIDDINVKAIICARGGYGSSRIIDQINFTSLQKSPKWIVGFSDITAFHLKLNVLGFESIHSTMPGLFSRNESGLSIESLRKVLFGEEAILTAPYNIFNKVGVATGHIIGGNLSLIVDSLATASEPIMAGKILILEEISEYLYKIDRMMNQLKRAGKLSQLAALVVGNLTDIHDTEISFGESVEQIIINAVDGYNIPLAFGFPTGHEEPNLAWRNGSKATLTVTESYSNLVCL